MFSLVKMLNKTQLITALILITLIICQVMPAAAREEKSHDQTEVLPVEDKVGLDHTAPASMVGHQSGKANAHGEIEHFEIPREYYYYWILLGSTCLITGLYCLRVFKLGKPKHEGFGLALFRVILAIAIYAADQFPALSRHFNSDSQHFEAGFHEPTTVATLKFWYKMALGVLLMIYGLLGKGHH